MVGLVGVAGLPVNTLQTSTTLPLLPVAANIVLPFLLNPLDFCAPAPPAAPVVEFVEVRFSGTNRPTWPWPPLITVVGEIGLVGLIAEVGSFVIAAVSLAVPNLGISTVMPDFFLISPVEAKAAGEGLTSPKSAEGGVCMYCTGAERRFTSMLLGPVGSVTPRRRNGLAGLPLPRGGATLDESLAENWPGTAIMVLRRETGILEWVWLSEAGGMGTNGAGVAFPPEARRERGREGEA
jgi:hypothetical protein